MTDIALHVKPVNANAPLQFSPITLNEDYCKKWNVHNQDFICLTRDGEQVSQSLYRVGGLCGDRDMKKGGYFLLLKYVEDFYSNTITKNKKEKAHLSARWCILDKNGIEKVEFNFSIDSPYLVKDSIIYSLNRKYYNIETGELYCYASSSMESDEYLFLQTGYSTPKERSGVMKIHKKTGKWELYPEK